MAEMIVSVHARKFVPRMGESGAVELTCPYHLGPWQGTKEGLEFAKQDVDMWQKRRTALLEYYAKIAHKEVPKGPYPCYLPEHGWVQVFWLETAQQNIRFCFREDEVNLDVDIFLHVDEEGKKAPVQIGIAKEIWDSESQRSVFRSLGPSTMPGKNLFVTEIVLCAPHVFLLCVHHIFCLFCAVDQFRYAMYDEAPNWQKYDEYVQKKVPKDEVRGAAAAVSSLLRVSSCVCFCAPVYFWFVLY